MLSDKFHEHFEHYKRMGLSKEESIIEAIHALEADMNADPTMQETFYKGPAGTFIPMRMLNPIKAYIDQGLYPGSFLMAIIEGNLYEACMHADSENIKNIPAFVDYFYNMAPPLAWGSKVKAMDWMRLGGLSGIKAAQ